MKENSDNSKLHADKALHIDLKNKECRANVITKLYSILRNKRGLLIYHKHRIELLIKLWYDSGGDKQLLDNNSVLNNNLHRSELKYYTDYDNIEREYYVDTECVLLNDTLPPISQYICVECIADYVDENNINCAYQTINGAVHLKTGTQHYLPSQDAQKLIKQGFVRCIQHNVVTAIK